MPNKNSPEETIRIYIQDQFLVTFGENFQAETDLFQAGIMDSFGYIQLIDFLQTTFDLEFDDEDILANVMVSLERMTAVVTANAASMSGTP